MAKKKRLTVTLDNSRQVDWFHLARIAGTGATAPDFTGTELALFKRAIEIDGKATIQQILLAGGRNLAREIIASSEQQRKRGGKPKAGRRDAEIERAYKELERERRLISPASLAYRVKVIAQREHRKDFRPVSFLTALRFMQRRGLVYHGGSES